jgi:hypothetical protein
MRELLTNPVSYVCTEVFRLSCLSARDQIMIIT